MITSNSIMTIFISLLYTSLYLTPTILSQTYSGKQGEWHLLQSSIGIFAMHRQLLHGNKVIMFDNIGFGPSNISLPVGNCQRNGIEDNTLDCTAHSILYDVAQYTVRPLTVKTDPWCSSGAVLPNGTILHTGGYRTGERTLRPFSPCNDDSREWQEEPNYLITRRWYATNQILPDGRVIIIGGRRQYNYEFYPREDSSSSATPLELLQQAYERWDENNLYPFVHLFPDGNLFIFANTESILFNYKQNVVVKELPGPPRRRLRHLVIICCLWCMPVYLALQCG